MDVATDKYQMLNEEKTEISKQGDILCKEANVFLTIIRHFQDKQTHRCAILSVNFGNPSFGAGRCSRSYKINRSSSDFRHVREMAQGLLETSVWSVY